MPHIGEIRRKRDAGYRGNGSDSVIWTACLGCGKERWVPYRVKQQKALDRPCKSCRQTLNRSSTWKGGIIKDKKGYVWVLLQPDDFFYPMANSHSRKAAYVAEHRLVVAKALGRNLHSWEIVHHKGTQYPSGSKEDKADNRYPENLEIILAPRHHQFTLMENRIKYLERLLVKNGIPIRNALKSANRVERAKRAPSY